MNPAVKLAGFAVVLAAVFGVSYLTGTQSQALLAPVQVHATDFGALSASSEGYTVRPVRGSVDPGRDSFIELALTGPGGAALPDPETVDLHVQVTAFREDFTGYQKVFPEQGDGTSWWPVLNLTPGPWRLIVTVEPPLSGPTAGPLPSTAPRREISLGTGFTVAGAYHPEPAPPPAIVAAAGRLTLTESGRLTTDPNGEVSFTVTDNGRPVTDLQPAHGSLGHLVIIRPGDFGYLHLHSTQTGGSGPRLDFVGGVPARGDVRMFVEVYRGDALQVAAYAVKVA